MSKTPQGAFKIDEPLPPDLLWRLRHPKFAVHPAHGSGFVSLATPENVADMKEAASEIDRLLAALVQIRGFAHVMSEDNWRDLRLHIERQTDILYQQQGGAK